MLELFIIFAFSNDETDAAERIEMVPGGANGVARKSILESMGGFKLEDVHCFDPNEEIDQAAIGGGGGGGGGEVCGSDSCACGQYPGQGQGRGVAWGGERLLFTMGSGTF